MGILDKAKKLAKDEQDAKRREEAAKAQRAKERAALLENTRKAVVKFLKDELHGQEGFKVTKTSKTDHHGTVATIYHKDEPFGIAIVKYEDYQFQGSDESPVETLEHVVLRVVTRLDYDSYRRNSYNYLSGYQYGFKEPVIASATIDWDEDITKAVKSLGDDLAKKLKDYV